VPPSSGAATSTSSSTTRASTPFGPTADARQDDFDAVYNINVKAPFFLVSALAPQMAERGKGAIVNIATMVATTARLATRSTAPARPQCSC
jgi:NAD(P)-dependent dehydrogenase (short-subunit alcohol dehydrogenase family)